ncbi:MAG: hypothetical protein KAS35_06950, partial [Candidatus Marinimicrobia bacterium]|nr:hypothetical protein [Candidatus Neomarinimicrobiota bacterium]
PLIISSRKNPKPLTNNSLIFDGTFVKNDNPEIDNPKPENVKKEIKLVTDPTPDSTSKNDISLDNINEKWDELIEILSSERPSIGNVLSHCEVSQFSGNRLEIKLINGNNFNLRTLEKNKIIIEKYFEKIYNTPIKTVFLMTKSDIPKKEKDVDKNNIKTNKTTEKLIELFNGEILN